MSYCIDPAQVERHITPNTTAILGVHLYSRPCDIEVLQRIADRRGLRLLFDAAHAFGCSHNGRLIGSFGDCEVLSFHATKFFNSFEGGAVTTNNDALAEKIRLMQNFGFAGMDKVIHIGTNGKMTEICAAMGLTNLEQLASFVTINRRNFECYREGLSGIQGITLKGFKENERCNWQYIVIEVGEDFPTSRDELMQMLHNHNIRARRYFWPGCHRMEPYRTYQPNAGLMLPVTESLSERILVLPTGTAISAPDISRICELVGSC